MAEAPMIDPQGLLSKILTGEGRDLLRDALEAVTTILMEVEATRLAGAAKSERTEDRKDHRNGYRKRPWDTRVGTLELQVPRLRNTGYVPSFLDPRKRSEKALLSVIQEAYVHGVSTRKVEDLLQALGMTGISKSEVSRICGELDGTVAAFRTRPLGGSRCPYVWLDAVYEKVRVDGRIMSLAVVIACGVRETGEREIFGVDVVPTENAESWKGFLRSLLERGLTGIQLVISDAHVGLKAAIREVLPGSSWQRCRVHFMRNALARVPKRSQPLISATLKTIFAQPSQAEARQQCRKIADSLRKTYSRLSELLDEAADDIIAYMAFPVAHWRQIHSTNPLERLNREVGRRTNVVGIFPNEDAVLRLVGALLLEQHEEWLVARRYFSQESMSLLYRKEERIGTEQGGAGLLPEPEHEGLAA